MIFPSYLSQGRCCRVETAKCQLLLSHLIIFLKYFFSLTKTEFGPEEVKSIFKKSDNGNSRICLRKIY